MFLRGVCVVCLLLTGSHALALTEWEKASPLPGAPKREYRAVWITAIENLDWPTCPATTSRGEEQQKQELRTMLDTLQAIGINTVLLQTRIRGDVIYPSLYEPFTSVFTGRAGIRPSYDPLRFAIDECHRRGMQCHAWMVALQVKDNRYVDPSSARVVNHLCTMVREVVRGYDIDGIHLDYIRYPEKTKGNDQWRRDNVTRCMEAVYRTVKAEKPWVCVSAATLGKYRDTRRASSSDWNAYHTVFQEAQEWTRRGIVDALFPMLYYRDKHYFPFVTDWAENAHGRHFVAGLGIYQLDRRQQNWELEAVRSQLAFMRSFEGTQGSAGMVYGNGAHGYALFRAGFLMDNTKGIKDEIRWTNRYPALVPAVPAVTAVSAVPAVTELIAIPTISAVPGNQPVTPAPPARLTGRITAQRLILYWGDAPLPVRRKSTPESAMQHAVQNTTVTAMQTSPQTPARITGGEVRYNVYRSVGSPVDTSCGAHLLLTYVAATSVTLPRVVCDEDVCYAVTAIDRYGNESEPVRWNDPVRALPGRD
jgi:uncharacterized lipoprotein YddW (UPF0748 family)